LLYLLCPLTFYSENFDREMYLGDPRIVCNSLRDFTRPLIRYSSIIQYHGIIILLNDEFEIRTTVAIIFHQVYDHETTVFYNLNSYIYIRLGPIIFTFFTYSSIDIIISLQFYIFASRLCIKTIH